MAQARSRMSNRLDSIRGRALCACLLAAAAASCSGFRRWPWSSTHESPGPMTATVSPLPAGDLEAVQPGPEEVLVVRHADPVEVRPAGAPASFPLSFHKKTVRLKAGSALYGAPGSRVEVLWNNGMHVVMFGQGSALLASPSRGEPSLVIRQLERAELHFRANEEIELLGGARLTSDGGPFLLDHARPQILRVHNRGKSAGRLAYRDEVYMLDPGMSVDLALLSSGGAPFTGDPSLRTVEGPGFQLQCAGAAQVEAGPDALVVRASGEHEVHALGLRLRMDRDETAVFEGRPGAAPAKPAAPAQGAPSAPEPAAAPAPADAVKEP